MLNPGVRQALLEFRQERDWEQFHTPLNLAVAISVEAAELLEQFQWKIGAEARLPPERLDAVEQEVADLAILLTYFAIDLNIDVEAAVERKLKLNALKYPVNEAKGNARKYDGPPL